MSNKIYVFYLHYFFFGAPLEKKTSRNKPVNTTIAPIHCRINNTFPNKITEPKTVKNFLVVVITEHGNGPNSVTVKNIKSCPKAPAKAKKKIWLTIIG